MRMGMKLKRYKEYKNSEVEWLGEIPQHWDLIANKYLFRVTKRSVGNRSKEYDLLSLTLKGIIKRDMINIQGKFPAEFDTYQEVKKNDFVFCLFDVQETPRTIGLSEFDGMITGAYTVMKPIQEVYNKFVYYFYLNLDSDKRLRSLYTGLRNIISKENFLSFKSFIPPLSEQKIIADYLDKKTSQIDKAIAQKEQIIELLKERKQILINKAVTRGLNPDVPLKDSGIDWIGKIPEHWEVIRLRYIGKTQNGISKSGDSFGSGYPFVSYSDVYKNESLPEEINGLVESNITDRKLYSVNKGDVFFTRTSEIIEEVGFTSVCTNNIANATYAGFLIRFRPQKGILDIGFSKYYFRSQIHRNFFVGEMNLVIRASLSQELLKRLPVLIPPICEQKHISDYLEEKCTKINSAITKKLLEIEKLKEYKATLIDSAVTGKICLTDN